MLNDDFKTPPPRKKANRKRPFKNREKRLGAREIVRRTEWLTYPLFYWPGEGWAAQTDSESTYHDVGTASQLVPSKTYTPIFQLILQRMHGLQPGLYALHVVDSITDPDTESFNPQIPTVIPVSKRRLARTNYAFEAAGKYPKALPRVVGDVQAYHDWVLERLHIIGTAIRSAEELLHDPDNLTALLRVQEAAFGIYPEQGAAMSPATLGEIAGEANTKDSSVAPDRQPSAPVSEAPTSGLRAAIILAGQQSLSLTFPPTLKRWQNLGRTCKAWPVELLATLNDEEALQLLTAARAESRLNSRFATRLFYEFRLLQYAGASSETERSKQLQEFIHVFGGLVNILEQLGSEPERRKLEFYQLLRQAFDTVCPHELEIVDTPGPKLAHTVDTRSVERAIQTEVFHRTFPDYQSMGVEEKDIHQSGITHAARWHTGYSREITFWKYMSDRLNVLPLAQVKQEVLNKIESCIEAKWQNPAYRWLDLLAGITGRLTTVLSPYEVHRFLSDWTEILHDRIPVGPHQDIPSQTTCGVLFSGKKIAKGDVNGIRHILSLLTEFGHRFIFPTLEGFSFKQITHNPLFLAAGTSGNLHDDEFRDYVNSVFEFDLEAAIESCHYRLRPGGDADGFVRLIDFFRALDSIETMQTNMAKMRFVELLMYDELPLPQFITQWLNSSGDKDADTWELLTAVLSDVSHELFDSEDNASGGHDRSERYRFLKQHLWILDAIVSVLQSYEAILAQGNCKGWRHTCNFSDEVAPLIKILFHNRHLGSVTLRLVSRHITTNILSMLDKEDEGETKLPTDGLDIRTPPSTFIDNLEDHKILLCSRLADGDAEALVNLLYSIQHSSALRYVPFDAGFDFLSQFPPITELLKALAQRPEMFDRLWYLVRKTFFLHRLQLHRVFASTQMPAWHHPQLSQYPDTPQEGFPSPDAQEKINRLYTYSLMSEREGKLPKAVRKIIAMPQAIRKEQQALQTRQAKHALTQSAEKRLQKVTALLHDPAELQQSLSEQLDAEYEKQLLLLKTEALAHILDRFLESYWYPIIGSRKKVFRNPDWDNAFYLYFTTDKNKRPLRRLLQALAQEDPQWPRQHPSNQQFLDEFARHGADPAEWLAPVAWKVTIHGRPYHLYIEPDPLKILQMGNYFDTCLSTGNFNAFATIANAVEVNKQVIYMRDTHDNVIARKLIAVVPTGFLACFNTYVSDPKLYSVIKNYTDLMCMDIAKRSGLGLLKQKDEDRFFEDDGEEFKVFCAWYFDGLEEIDWWMVKLGEPGYDLARLEQEIQERENAAEFEAVSPQYSPELRARLWIETVTNFRDHGKDSLITVAAPPHLKPSSVVAKWSNSWA